MAGGKLRFWRRVEASPGPVTLRFARWPGVALRFQRPVEPTPGPVRLVFGPYVAPEFPTVDATLAGILPLPPVPGLVLSAQGEAVAPPDIVEATLAAALPPPSLPALTLSAIDGTLRIDVAASLPVPVLPGMTAAATVSYILDLPDADGVGIVARQQQGRRVRTPLAITDRPPLPARIPLAAGQQQGVPMAVGCAARHQHMLPASRAARLEHAQGLRTGGGVGAVHAESLRSRRRLVFEHQHGERRTHGRRLPYAEAVRRRRFARLAHVQGVPLANGQPVRHQHGLFIAKRFGLRHAQMIPLPVGWWQATYPWPEPPPPPGSLSPSSPVELIFCRLYDGTTRLVFGCPVPDPGPDPDAPVVVPLLRTYIMLNNVTLTRVSNGLALPALSLDVRIDSDSWSWGWSATLPSAHLDNLDPDSPGAPVELEASINGQTWRLLAERISRDRRFGRDRISVSGRGIAAELADPLYPAESRDNTGGALTAQQLAAAALTINGVPLGWALSWQIPDWLVPAGAWVHTGTPIEAVARIAQAAGGYVQADPVERTLHVLARYPVLPWEWGAATPDFILPSAATTREATEYVSRPDYNAVYVSGTDIGGVLGHVVKTGTAGDQHAEMVVDALITHADAARGRGGAILGDTGPQAIMTLETPVLDTIGTYPVGALIEWQEGADSRRGIVRSLRVAADLPRVRQTVEVETHG